MKLKYLNLRQISALIKKDVLVRLRQPWMTFLQYFWPCAIFLSLYILRLRFQPHQIGNCQFPTRQLPSSELLPFFQSYICSIENQCQKVNEYEETSSWNKAAITPVLNIVQTFLNEKDLFDAVVDLPKTMEFIPLVTKLATHSKFKYIESNADFLVRHLPDFQKQIGSFFDVHKLFSNHRVFSNLGKILCGKPFPVSNNIRFVENIIYSPDYNGPDKDELDVMPTPYCKQLYMDVTNSNHGKITWKILKPIIQGKILYGPANADTDGIVGYGNHTFSEVSRLREFFRSLETTIKMLNTNKEFRSKFDSLLNLAKSPIVQAILGGAVDIQTIETVLNSIVNDSRVSDVVETIGNIFDCFSVDRFVAVKDEKELEDVAYELAKKKMFYAAVFFTNDASTKEIVYKLRMEADNTPVTIENRNRFYFPGAEANFELEMRYHRGFIEIQNSIDSAIIKFKKRLQFESTHPLETSEDLDFSDLEFKDHETSGKPSSEESDDDFGGLELDENGDFGDENKTTTSEPSSTSTTSTPAVDFSEIFKALQGKINISDSDVDKFSDDGDFWNFDDDEDSLSPEERSTSTTSTETTETPSLSRKKRQLDSILSMFGLGGGELKEDKNVLKFEINKMKLYTKQFPYPEYTRDDFKKGLYLAQAIQMSFFFALIIQISSSVRQKIWFKESGNLSLMRTMGLQESSDLVSWLITTFVELAIVFLLAVFILYTGGIMEYSSKVLIYSYLLTFGLCVISFSYMSSCFYSTATIGSVSTVILFLITFLPYIVIISLGTVLGMFGKFLANLSLSTAFCYAWHYILRIELQEKSFSFSNAFSGSFAENDFKFGVAMIIFDTVLYIVIGYFAQKFFKDDTTFYKVERKNLGSDIGAKMTKVTMIYEDCDPNKPAVDNVSIEFKKDEVLCLLGRNGAGKSTVLKLLTGQLLPSFGEIHLPLDYDLITGFKNHQEQIGLCSQNNVLIPNLTAQEHLELYAQLKLRKGFAKEVRRVMSNMKLGKYKNNKVFELSGGYKRRLCIAIAFLGSPNLVVLDEPCGSLDTHARKTIWELIESLRKNRAVLLATHDLDEAQHLGDNIIIMKDGRIALQSNTKDLQNELTKSFTLHVQLKASLSIDKDIANEIKEVITTHTSKIPPSIFNLRDCILSNVISYCDEDGKTVDYSNLFRALEKLQSEKKVLNFSVESKTLNDLYKSVEEEGLAVDGNGHVSNNNNIMETIDLRKTVNGLQNNDQSAKRPKKVSLKETVTNLVHKRFLHFRRNYKLMICILVLPVIFEIIAMGFMKIRPPGDYDNSILFNRALYPDSVEFYTKENANEFGEKIHKEFEETCALNKNCNFFNSSKDSFKWILKTHEQFIGRRYGGISINDSRSIVWYNNKGYHSMPLYLNVLNSAIFKKEMNDSSYSIKTLNHPLKLGEQELSVSSILQQVADSGISLILLLSFSLVLSGASVYIVNERISGEKLQQKLCGVGFRTYWGVAFLWDFAVYFIAILLAVIVFKFFNIPVYVERDNLLGIVLLLLCYGFASIPAVHLFEKLFSEASFANMSIFCLNVIIALSTLTTIVIFDVLAENYDQEQWRNFLNRLFLVFPQHALSDGLIEICKNHIMSKIFIRYYINTYKSPVNSDLLKPHFTSLIVMGLVFIVLNYIIESGLIWRVWKTQPKREVQDLNVVTTIQNTLTKEGKVDSSTNYALKVSNLFKTYSGSTNYAVNDVSFKVNLNECYGLLGANGAGKSSIFSILSGDTKRFSGSVDFINANGLNVSYCPQSNALDMLLTVEEIIHFYGKLRNVSNLESLTKSMLDNFHLKIYKDVLVKNLSGGNRRKLSVACSSFGDLSLVLMDEPTSDMDPLTRHLVYKTIHELNDNNCSVILTSHSVAEIEELCHSIGVLVDGKMCASGSPESLKKQFGNRYVVTMFSEIPLDYQFETDLRKTFRSLTNLMSHHYSSQFTIQVRDFENVDHCHMNFSELLDLLNAFTAIKNLKYALTAAMLDNCYDTILKKGLDSGYENNGFVSNEYQS